MPTVMRLDAHPPSKRQKLDQPDHARRNGSAAPRPSKIFTPFRTIGLVSPTPIPFASQPLGKAAFHITTSAGRSLQTYDLKRGLNLVFATRPETPGPITAVASSADKVFAAWSTASDASIWIFKRGKRVGHLSPPPNIGQNIVEILVFGPWIVACCSTAIHVWKLENLEFYTTIWSPLADSQDAVLTGGIATLPTFANKIFAGRADGSVEIWNISTGRLVYRILSPDSAAGAVSAMKATPALSLLAIAYANGRLNIHDVQTDQQVLSFNASPSPDMPITSISFRTDGLGAGANGQQAGMMATASFGGVDVTLWDLNDGGRRMATLRGAHDATAVGEGVSKIEFLASQAVLVTSGSDNTLKTWIFDHTPSSPIPRLLHSRSGHGSPVKHLSFLPTDADGADFTGKWLLSASEDQSLWGWSLRRDGQSTELSQGSVQKKVKNLGTGGQGIENGRQARSLKAPPVTCMACSLNRDGGMAAAAGDRTIWASAKQVKGKSSAVDPNLTGWESIITGHAGDRLARTWFWGRRRAGRWGFETGDGANVQSVSVSPCGTFAVIGSASGGIDMFNLQSGQHRQRFPPRLTPAQANRMQLDRAKPANADMDDNTAWAKGLGKHTNAVTGIEIDSLNTYVVSCSLDGHVKFWDFLNGKLLHDIDWHASTSILSMKLHRPSNLLAISCSDRFVRVVDIESRRVVRELWSTVSSDIKDYCFSNDGRWIVVSSADAILRVWDLPTGHLIDAVRLRSPATALAFSDTGDFLALAQSDSVGIDLWTNKALFRYISTQPLSESDIAHVTSSTSSGEGGQHVLASALDDEQESQATAEDEQGPLPNVEQLSRDVETLSLVPRTKWHNLLHLEALRERNKPVEPPKAPEKAPFFLPSLASDSERLVIGQPDQQFSTESTAEPSRQEISRIVKMDRSLTQSRFTYLLHALQANATDESTGIAFIENLKALSPSQADIEIRSLDAGSSRNELVTFVQALTSQLERRRDYELVQAWMAVFLRCHGDLVAQDAEADPGGRLVRALHLWRSQQCKEAQRLSSLAAYCSGVVGFMRSTR